MSEKKICVTCELVHPRGHVCKFSEQDDSDREEIYEEQKKELLDAWKKHLAEKQRLN